ncbi:MAG: class II aldolase/adducin family protein [Armatimonadota bacterium]
MKSEAQHRREICEVGRRLWLRGFVAANDGNISVRIADDEILATPTGVSKGFMSPHDIAKVDLSGRVVAGDTRPSSELGMHLAIYQRRPDVCAVVHAHPPTSTGFAAAGRALEAPIVTEVVSTLGRVPLIEFARPSTHEVPEAMAPYIADYDAFLLANHGVVTLGPDVLTAYHRMETVEHYANISLVTRQLGGEVAIPATRLPELEAERVAAFKARRARTCLVAEQCQAREAAAGGLPPSPGDAADFAEKFVSIIASAVMRHLHVDDA